MCVVIVQAAGSDEPRLVSIRGRRPEFLTAVATPSNRRLTAAARPLLDDPEDRGKRFVEPTCGEPPGG